MIKNVQEKKKIRVQIRSYIALPFEKMPLLYFDYVKSADLGSEKKILV